MTDRISAGERPKPDSMMCVNCGTVVFHAVELDTQRCRCGVGAGCWVCNYSKVSVSIIEHEDKISSLSSELEKAKENNARLCQMLGVGLIEVPAFKAWFDRATEQEKAVTIKYMDELTKANADNATLKRQRDEL